jgi:hypothetical protein
VYIAKPNDLVDPARPSNRDSSIQSVSVDRSYRALTTGELTTRPSDPRFYSLRAIFFLAGADFGVNGGAVALAAVGNPDEARSRGCLREIELSQQLADIGMDQVERQQDTAASHKRLEL